MTTSQPRTVVWFSAGAASAVAAKLTIGTHNDTQGELLIAYIDPGSEHPDNQRFLKDCEAWFARPIVRLKSNRYSDTWEVFTKERYLVGPFGAKCTTELKKKVRYAFQLPTDIQVFGYTAEEQHRADQFREQNPGVDLSTPLIDRGLNKADCLSIISRSGIELPAMYRLGYSNANCIGCVKGGMGYWNRIRRDFPDVFERMARLERELGHTVLRSGGVGVYLDELDPNRGRFDEMAPECSLVCSSIADELADPKTEVKA